MEFVDEGNDLTIRVIDFFKNGFEAFFKFTAIFCSGNQRGDIKGDKLLIFEAVGNVTGDNTLGESFNDSCFSDSWFTDQDGVVFGATGQHLADTADFCIATDDRVELAALSNFSEVDTELFERALLFLLRLLLHKGCFSL